MSDTTFVYSEDDMRLASQVLEQRIKELEALWHADTQRLSNLVTRIEELEAERDALKVDAERVDWLEKLFSHHWDGTIGRPRSWSIVGHWRHVVQLMRGHSFREAIDAARASNVK